MATETRPKIMLIHFNKQRAKKALPWTVHAGGVCHAASRVVFSHVPVETVFKPDKKQSPRAWMRTRGWLKWSGTVAVILNHR